ncbi:MAG: TetR/AcrR family transcriptional regulator [Myxococcales bacterium]|nr:TetR/AcrR family transcriptional regulator [Myxococcales bacterium]
MSGSLPATARGRATRKALLVAAESVFGETRYGAAAITEITRRAGVAQGTFYVYFPNKKAIFLELVSHLGSELRATLTSAVTGAPDRLTREELGLRAFLAFVGDHRNLYRIVRQAEFIDEGAYRAYYERFAEGYRAGLAEAVQAGEVADVSLEALSYALMGISDFIGMRWVLWEEQGGVPEDVIAAVLHLLRHGLGPVP